jgi:hypothetical protein
MPKGELFINGQDAYTRWGMSMNTAALSALMTPAPNKSYLTNSSRNENGVRYDTSNPCKDERDLTLVVQFSAPTEAAFMAAYADFCKVLDAGVLNISTQYQSGVTYHLIYNSCSQFTQFMRGMASFTLRLTEPNPANRS